MFTNISCLSLTTALVLTIFLASCAATQTTQDKVTETAQNKNAAVAQPPKREFLAMVPKDNWVPVFFKAINERADIAALRSLRTAALPNDDLETRLWIGFGLSALAGFDLKRSNGQWSGIYIQGIRPHLPKDQYQLPLQAPKSGWDQLWQSLTAKGLLTLPDAASIACQGGGLDGLSYVVEYNADNTYRTYMYDNPQYATCKEAKQMIEIAKLFEEEFGPQLPRY